MQNQLEDMLRNLSTRLDRIELEGMKEKIKKYSWNIKNNKMLP